MEHRRRPVHRRAPLSLTPPLRELLSSLVRFRSHARDSLARSPAQRPHRAHAVERTRKRGSIYVAALPTSKRRTRLFLLLVRALNPRAPTSSPAQLYVPPPPAASRSHDRAPPPAPSSGQLRTKAPTRPWPRPTRPPPWSWPPRRAACRGSCSRPAAGAQRRVRRAGWAGARAAAREEVVEVRVTREGEREAGEGIRVSSRTGERLRGRGKERLDDARS